MNVLIFLAVLFVLILVHELGHFLTAKWFKMRVDEFAIGFPPRLFSWRRGETEYSLNALPIGGYVKILGENGMEDVRPEDQSRAFGARPKIHQAIVLIAGVAMNVLTAWLIFFAVSLIGTPTVVEDTAASDRAKLTVTSVLETSPAEEANIPLGSVITDTRSANDQLNQLTPSEFTAFIARHSADEIEITYQYRDESTAVVVTPQAGVIEEEMDRRAIGLSTALVETVRENPLEALSTATLRTGQSLLAIVVGIFSLLSSALTFSADLSDVAGPIGIANLVGEAAEFGLVTLLTFVAFISLNLAVINLLPIPALDGGRLLFVAIEAIVRRPINPEWMARVNLVGFVLLIGLMIVVTLNDVSNLI